MHYNVEFGCGMQIWKHNFGIIAQNSAIVCRILLEFAEFYISLVLDIQIPHKCANASSQAWL